MNKFQKFNSNVLDVLTVMWWRERLLGRSKFIVYLTNGHKVKFTAATAAVVRGPNATYQFTETSQWLWFHPDDIIAYKEVKYF